MVGRFPSRPFGLFAFTPFAIHFFTDDPFAVQPCLPFLFGAIATLLAVEGRIRSARDVDKRAGEKREEAREREHDELGARLIRIESRCADELNRLEKKHDRELADMRGAVDVLKDRAETARGRLDNGDRLLQVLSDRLAGLRGALDASSGRGGGGRDGRS